LTIVKKKKKKWVRVTKCGAGISNTGLRDGFWLAQSALSFLFQTKTRPNLNQKKKKKKKKKKNTKKKDHKKNVASRRGGPARGRPARGSLYGACG
jgi:hypothetical protein